VHSIQTKIILEPRKKYNDDNDPGQRFIDVKFVMLRVLQEKQRLDCRAEKFFRNDSG